MSLCYVQLDKGEHDRKGFDAGKGEGRETLTDYLHAKAARQQKQNFCRVFVQVEEAAPSRIIGYYTLSNGDIVRDSVGEKAARKLPMHPIPVLVLGRLAVDHTEQGKGYGELVLMDALHRSALVAQQTGVYAVVTDPLNDGARRFYEKYGFMPLPDVPDRLFLPLTTALKALAASTRS